MAKKKSQKKQKYYFYRRTVCPPEYDFYDFSAGVAGFLHPIKGEKKLLKGTLKALEKFLLTWQPHKGKKMREKRPYYTAAK